MPTAKPQNNCAVPRPHIFSSTVIKPYTYLNEKQYLFCPWAANLSRESDCLSEKHPAVGTEAWLHGRTHTAQQGQIWMAPVKKVNPKSLAGARKSERDGPDSQSARGRRLFACEQSTNPPNCVATSSSPSYSPLIRFQSCTFWIMLFCNSSQVLFYNLIWYFNLGELGYGFRTPCRIG